MTFILIVILIILYTIHMSYVFKVAYYEALIERLRDEQQVNIGPSFDKVKNNFWEFMR